MRRSRRARVFRFLRPPASLAALLLPAPRRPGAADPVVLRVGTTQDLDSPNPYETVLVVGYEAFGLASSSSSTPARPRARRQASPTSGNTPRMADRRRSTSGRHEVVRRPAGDVRGRLLLVAARPRRHRRREVARRPATSNRRAGRGHHQGGPARTRRRWSRRPTTLSDRVVPGLPADHPEAHLRQGDLQDHRRGQVQRAAASARGRIPPPNGGPASTSASSGTRTTGARGFEDEVDIVIYKKAGHDGPGAQGRRPRLRPRPDAEQLNALKTEPNIQTVVGSANGWTRLAFNEYRTDTGKTTRAAGRRRRRSSIRRSVSPRLRGRQEGAGRPRAGRIRRRRRDHGAARAARRTSTRPSRGRRHRAREAEARRRGLRPRRERQAPRQGRQPIDLRLFMPIGCEPSEGGPVHQGLVRPARDQGDHPVESAATLAERILPPEAGNNAYGPSSTSSCGWAARSIATACSWSSGARGSGPRRTGGAATRRTTGCTRTRIEGDVGRGPERRPLDDAEHDLRPRAGYDILYYDSNLDAYRTDKFAGLARTCRRTAPHCSATARSTTPS